MENTPKDVCKKLLWTIFVLVLVYGWIFTEESGNMSTFQSGYSSTFLMVLYLLIRYIRIHYFSQELNNKWKRKSQLFWLLLWWGALTINVLLWIFAAYLNIGQIYSRIFMYTSPLVIMQSLSMFLFFHKLQIKSKFINRVGNSSLSIMLIHGWCNLELFRLCINTIYYNNNGIICIIIIAFFLLSISFCGVALDQVRLFLWGKIAPHIKLISLY